MKQNTILCIVLLVGIIFVISLPAFSKDHRKIDENILQILKSSVTLDAKTRGLMNAITNNDIKDLSFNRIFYNQHNDIFNVKIQSKPITNQKHSGRCWLFAGLNIMRPAVLEKYNLSEFEFSQNYLFFYDKLEKANMFLEAIIETRDRDINDREIQVLVENPVPDGGWWNYVVNLIEKYGAVPKEFMPDTKNATNTKMMNTMLNNLMRHNAVELRKLSREGIKITDLNKQKVNMLKEVYRILLLHLGIPPESFIWRIEDKDHKITAQTYTPGSFYKEVVGLDLSKYVSLFNHPVHAYSKYYRIRYCRNMSDQPDMDFINLKIDKLKDFALTAILDGEPVWFAADIGKQNDGKNGILSNQIYDYETLYDVQSQITKAERVSYRSTSPNHAMVFVGVDTLKGNPVKWYVENSWGDERGNDGYWTMYNDWFDSNVFAVIIHENRLPTDILKLLDTKPIILPAWDPMRFIMN